MARLLFLAGLLLPAWLGAAATAAELYVSPNGDDANPGTSPDKAVKTIARAASLAEAGTVVNIAPGTYQGRVVLPKSGTAKAPIVFRKRGDGEAVWTVPAPDPKNWAERFALSLQNREHIILDGITFRDCGAWLFMFDTNHATIRNCVFDGCRMYNGIQLKNAGYNRFLNCKFLKAIPIKEWKKMSDWWHQPARGADYIEIYFNSHHNLVEDCQFGEIAHVAVSIAAFQPGHTATRNVIRNCTFKDPVWKCIGLGACEYTLIENNLCTGVAAMFIQLQSPKTIVRRNLFVGYREVKQARAHVNLHSAMSLSSVKGRNLNYQGTTPEYAQHNRIYNNLFYDNDKCTAGFSWKAPIVDNLFENNIFYKNKTTVFLPAPDYTGANRNFFVNNLMQGVAPGAKLVQLENDQFTLAEVQQKLNELYRDNFEADPQFVNSAKGEFRLKPGSPCVDKGAALTQTTSDGLGAEVPVEDALYFCDGFDLIAADEITVGTNKPVRITQVDYDRKVLKVEREIAWKKGDSVNLAYHGAGPDIGPYELGAKKAVIGRRVPDARE
ncbi:MAG TPA: right-handed parallel beta-helix repeat-containing protein [Phycisphaerae bacterium]|nr:right-handed parallel beta-helix repeat-containing protein [Phycisphaerae bacterium]